MDLEFLSARHKDWKATERGCWQWKYITHTWSSTFSTGRSRCTIILTRPTAARSTSRPAHNQLALLFNKSITYVQHQQSILNILVPSVTIVCVCMWYKECIKQKWRQTDMHMRILQWWKIRWSKEIRELRTQWPWEVVVHWMASYLELSWLYLFTFSGMVGENIDERLNDRFTLTCYHKSNQAKILEILGVHFTRKRSKKHEYRNLGQIFPYRSGSTIAPLMFSSTLIKMSNQSSSSCDIYNRPSYR